MDHCYSQTADDDSKQQPEKFRTIVKHLTKYARCLLSARNGSKLSDQEMLFRRMEEDLMLLSGDDGSQGYMSETLQELRSSVLGNHIAMMPSACSTATSFSIDDTGEMYETDDSDRTTSTSRVPASREVSSSDIPCMSEAPYYAYRADSDSSFELLKDYNGYPYDPSPGDAAGEMPSSSFLFREYQGQSPATVFHPVNASTTKYTTDEGRDDENHCEGKESSRYLEEEDDSSSGCGDQDASGVQKNKRLNKSATEFLTRWLIDHQEYPFPSQNEKVEMSRLLHLTPQQVGNWMTNMRKRHLYPVITGKRAPKTPLDFAMLERHNSSTASLISKSGQVRKSQSVAVPSRCSRSSSRPVHRGDPRDPRDPTDENDCQFCTHDKDDEDDDGTAIVFDVDANSRLARGKKRAPGESECFSSDKKSKTKHGNEEFPRELKSTSACTSDMTDDLGCFHGDRILTKTSCQSVKQVEDESYMVSCGLGSEWGDMDAFEKDLWSSVARCGGAGEMDDPQESCGTVDAVDCRTEPDFCNIVDDDQNWFDAIALNMAHGDGSLYQDEFDLMKDFSGASVLPKEGSSPCLRIEAPDKDILTAYGEI